MRCRLSVRAANCKWQRRDLSELEELLGSIQLALVQGAHSIWTCRCRLVQTWWFPPECEPLRRDRVLQRAKRVLRRRQQAVARELAKFAERRRSANLASSLATACWRRRSTRLARCSTRSLRSGSHSGGNHQVCTSRHLQVQIECAPCTKASWMLPSSSSSSLRSRRCHLQLAARTLKRQRILNTFRKNPKCGRQWISLPREAPSR